MEKFTQFRTGVSPFMPVKSQTSPLGTLFHPVIFLIRLPIFLAYSAVYFLLIDFLPLPSFLRKAFLWTLLFIPGVFWADVHFEGVRRGALSAHPHRVPRAGDIIAANFSSPLDALYTAAVFNPVFTQAYPGERRVLVLSLFAAALRALAPAAPTPPAGAQLVDIAQLQRAYPDRVVLVFPECSTTNGAAILPLSPCVVSAREGSRIFPVSLRYVPSDVTTPVPGAWGRFLFALLSHSSIRIHVRIAEAVVNTVAGEKSNEGPIAYDEEEVISKVCDGLSRLGRSAKVGLTLKDKQAFCKAWAARK
ncbi:hypothetical protein TD95_003320 [Thielaviopsis punctulata]|uniref:Phospholipid/glycerol acyltransferase domain-containing protein n=1 Tax=Thielaviopsis punctulata TaxID=72032 RepID=A0A0F4ZDD0_9PEZI|nr:hypothetical protein TD95_003320 [Thielaviopsis punctulata]